MTPHPRTASRALAAALAALTVASAAPTRAADIASPQPAAGASSASQPAAARAGEQRDAAAPPPGSGAAPVDADGVKRVVFIPETVKAQLRDEIKKEVLEEAKRDGWAAPNQVPAWLKRFTFGGDVRARYDRTIFPAGNANGGEFPDFNAINTNKPFDVNGVDLSADRFLNVDENRTRPRLRARLGVEVDLGKGFQSSIRLGSGDSASPVSSNQTMGNVFSKYQIWLDRAWLTYQPVRGASSLALLVGRFDRPFFGTDLLWWDDLAFDGVALQAEVDAGGGLKPFFNGGAFPVYTTAFAFPPEQPSKFPSLNKWLYAAQVGTSWAPTDAFSLKVGAAFYDFDKVEGRTSSPCDTNLANISCNTDESRPSFAQKGNTYMALRTPSDAALSAEPGAPRYEFFGLASRFREIAVTGRIESRVASSLKATLEGEYAYNAGFKKRDVSPVALNNRGAIDTADPLGPFDGGNRGVLGRMGLGSPALHELWDWRARVSYRYLESDAVLDALNDPDFGLGGTNLKGYALDFTLALSGNVQTVARWFSANQIAGPKFSVDVLQIDLLARF